MLSLKQCWSFSFKFHAVHPGVIRNTLVPVSVCVWKLMPATLTPATMTPHTIPASRHKVDKPLPVSQKISFSRQRRHRDYCYEKEVSDSPILWAHRMQNSTVWLISALLAAGHNGDTSSLCQSVDCNKGSKDDWHQTFSTGLQSPLDTVHISDAMDIFPRTGLGQNIESEWYGTSIPSDTKQAAVFFLFWNGHFIWSQLFHVVGHCSSLADSVWTLALASSDLRFQLVLNGLLTT